MSRVQRILCSLLLAFAVPAYAASPDFYTELLQRGIAHVNEGKDEQAIRELRIAAFGFLDDIPRFQLAHAYIAVASKRLGREADARYALQRIVAAERIERTFATLELPQSVRKEVDALAGALLTSEQLAVLRGEGARVSASAASVATKQ